MIKDFEVVRALHGNQEPAFRLAKVMDGESLMIVRAPGLETSRQSEAMSMQVSNLAKRDQACVRTEVCNSTRQGRAEDPKGSFFVKFREMGLVRSCSS